MVVNKKIKKIFLYFFLCGTDISLKPCSNFWYFFSSYIFKLIKDNIINNISMGIAIGSGLSYMQSWTCSSNRVNKQHIRKLTYRNNYKRTVRKSLWRYSSPNPIKYIIEKWNSIFFFERGCITFYIHCVMASFSLS